MEDNENESLIAEQRFEGYRNSVNCDPDGNANVADICGNQPNPNEPLASEIETIDEDRGNPSLQTSGNCSEENAESRPILREGRNTSRCLERRTVLCVVFGGLFLIMVVVMMVVHRLNLLNNYCYSEFIVIWIFFIPQIAGCVCFALLIHSRYRNFTVRNRKRGFTFAKLKLILMYIFGLGYLFHSGLFAWKHNLPEDCPENSILDFSYELFCMLYTFISFNYFALFYGREREYTVKENCALVGIVVANLCIWLNAIVFESDFLNKRDLNNDNSSAILNITKSSNRAIEAIEKTDTFCSPAMVEFSLMANEMLFINSDNIGDCSSNDNSLATNEQNNYGKISYFVGIFVQIFFSLAAFLFFAFVFTVVLTTNSSDDFLTYPEYLNVYVGVQLIMKFIMLFLISFCLMHELKFLKYQHKLRYFVLYITFAGNMFYHGLYCFVIVYDDDVNLKQPIVESLIVNSVSLLLALAQLLFIVGIHSTKHDYFRKRQQCSERNFVYYACFILGVLNLGFWITDSIGEDRLLVISIAYHWVYQKFGSPILYTIIFPLTIFFRFQTGLEFLEFCWEHN